MSQAVGAAVIGAGYWGPNVVRNFRGSSEWDLVVVCDLDEDRAKRAVGARSSISDHLAACRSALWACDSEPRLPW